MFGCVVRDIHVDLCVQSPSSSNRSTLEEELAEVAALRTSTQHSSLKPKKQHYIKEKYEESKENEETYEPNEQDIDNLQSPARRTKGVNNATMNDTLSPATSATAATASAGDDSASSSSCTSCALLQVKLDSALAALE